MSETATPYGARWYWCDVLDASEVAEEPDWSRVPEAKRAIVRQRWLEKAAPVQRTQLWGPQISFFQSLPYYTVTVIR